VERALASSADLLLLDVLLPGKDGFEILRELRKSHPQLPVILLTARGAEEDRVRGLKLGADDYVVKPFSPRELSARVKAVLRRARTDASSPGTTAARALVVNSSKRQVTFFGEQLQLSKYEYEILTTFIGRPGHVFSREQLMSLLWEQPEQSLDRTVDAHIKNLRAKLRAVRADIDPIVTHRGTGYSLREDL
jgi:two-component system catabolic regulation response regulator CreB